DDHFLASDAAALLQVTRRVAYLEEGDVADVRRESYAIYDAIGQRVMRTVVDVKGSGDAVELGPYRHFMQKEIFEQPRAIADTLAALKHAKSLGQNKTLAICNVATSSMVRQTELVFLTRAGVEIGVASTKAFTTQLTVHFLLALTLAKLRGLLPADEEAKCLKALRHLPAAIRGALALEPHVMAWAQAFAHKQHALFLGRGLHYPIALEGALKLKEIS